MITIKKLNKESYNIKNRNEFENLFRNKYSELCSYANMFLKEIDASEETVQDIFVNLWENRNKLKIRTSINSYLYRAVRNSSLNKLKHIEIKEKYKKYNKNELENNFISHEEGLEKNELNGKIRKTIDLLPTKRRKIFIMSRYHNLKYKEIAEEENISIKTVENQIGKAMKFLKKELYNFLK